MRLRSGHHSYRVHQNVKRYIGATAHQNVLLQRSAQRHTRYWRAWGGRFATRVGLGVGSVAAAGLANYFTKVPRLHSDMRMLPAKRRRFAGDQGRNGDPDVFEVAEVTRTSASKGKRFKKNFQNLWRLVGATRDTVGLRYQSINPYFTTACGAQKLFWHRNTTAVTGRTTYPVHIYMLNTAINSQDGGATLSIDSPIVGAMTKVINTDSITWAPEINYGMQNNTNNGGGTTGARTWVITDTSKVATDPSNGIGQAGVFKWADVRMMCYGRSTTPTKYTIVIFKILEDTLNPSATGADSQRMGMMWDNITSQYLYNPILAPGQGRQTGWKNMQVVMRKDFTLGSVTSIEGDTLPHAKEVKMFFHPNQLQRYDWAQRNRLNENIGGVAPGGDDDYIVNTHSWSTRPNNKALFFMAVIAQSRFTTSALDPSFTVVDNPSYDICIRTSHSTATSVA